jgi:hypothetical protein
MIACLMHDDKRNSSSTEEIILLGNHVAAQPVREIIFPSTIGGVQQPLGALVEGNSIVTVPFVATYTFKMRRKFTVDFCERPYELSAMPEIYYIRP